MERLTTEKPTKEMGMYELAMNCCYVKDNLARYRDFETDVDARDLARQLLKKYADGDDAFVDDDDFDEEMLELLIYGTDTIEGLIAVFYRNLWAMAELREQLKAYEQAEEDGLLPRNPKDLEDAILERMQEFMDEWRSYSESSVDHFGGKADAMEVAQKIVKGAFKSYLEEAEQALAKMKGV